MMVLGNSYFWKFLEHCDPAQLNEYGEALHSTLSHVTATEYTLVQPGLEEREKIRRWSEGSFNGPGEQKLKFPRASFVYQPQSGNPGEHWIASVFFTRVPHIVGLYGNRSTNHLLAPSVERELSVRLTECYLADEFNRMSNNSLVGTPSGLYVYQKVRHIAALRNWAEDSKYVPPGSELRELLQSLSAVLPERRSSSSLIELPNKNMETRNFLRECDHRVLQALGQEELGRLLKPVDVPVQVWLKAGTRGILGRLLTV